MYEKLIPLLSILPSIHKIIAENPTTLDELLNQYGEEFIKQPGERGYSPLHTAVFHQRPESAQALISAGAELNEINEDQETPLILAIKKGCTEIALDLIKAGANYRLCDQDGLTPLCHAIMAKDMRIIQALLAKGVSISEKAFPLAHTDAEITALLNRTLTFRGLFFRFEHYLCDNSFARELDVIIEFFQNICFQLSMMQTPQKPESAQYLQNYAGYYDNILSAGEQVRQNIAQLSFADQIQGTKEFKALLVQHPKHLITEHLLPALSRKHPTASFFNPITTFELAPILKISAAETAEPVAPQFKSLAFDSP